MKIEQVTRFEVDGKEFTSLAKAKDHVDGMVNKALQNALTNGGGIPRFTVTDCVVITEALLSHRAFFAELLSVKMPDEDDDE